MRKNPLKMLWLAAAFLCLGIGAVGVILPILPTTPFLLVASFCFSKRIGKISQVVYGDEALQKSSGQLCKGACHDIKDKAVYSASGIRNADVCIFYDEQSAGAYFYSSADPFLNMYISLQKSRRSELRRLK